MQTARRRFLRTLLFGNFPPPPSPASSSIATLVRGSLDRSLPCATLAAPWSALQSRGAKVLGTDVLKAQHTQHGRGGATIQAPPFVETGDEIIINTTDDSYITRTILRISTYGRPSGCTDERIRVE
ncbi:Elongation factor [Musa troglodytarum]|uniref:Elongation factor n=1 Tax=Musa troglodytarum TaxID=320322 RepID=A0A9E7KJQ4_9LILI|nr:Elongation factor [Musa troglodytarum]